MTDCIGEGLLANALIAEVLEQEERLSALLSTDATVDEARIKGCQTLGALLAGEPWPDAERLMKELLSAMARKPALRGMFCARLGTTAIDQALRRIAETYVVPQASPKEQRDLLLRAIQIARERSAK